MTRLAHWLACYLLSRHRWIPWREAGGWNATCRDCGTLTYFPRDAWTRRVDTGWCPRQTTWVWCPICDNELCSDSDAYLLHTAEGLVEYRCSKCQAVSRWNFDTPSPFIVSQGLL